MWKYYTSVNVNPWLLCGCWGGGRFTFAQQLVMNSHTYSTHHCYCTVPFWQVEIALQVTLISLQEEHDLARDSNISLPLHVQTCDSELLSCQLYIESGNTSNIGFTMFMFTLRSCLYKEMQYVKCKSHLWCLGNMLSKTAYHGSELSYLQCPWTLPQVPDRGRGVSQYSCGGLTW